MRSPITDWRTSAVSALLLVLSSSPPSAAWYLPGVVPTTYETGQQVPLHVNRLTPSHSQVDMQVRSVFAYDYYSNQFHFCKPEGGPVNVDESLGSILFGDRIKTSPFELRMLQQEEECRAVCEEQTFSAGDARFVNKRIRQSYEMNWLVDGLPAAQVKKDLSTDTTFYSPGFALGGMEGGKPYLHNHYDITVNYHLVAPNQYRVVGVIVEPLSMSGSKFVEGGKGKCGNPDQKVFLSESKSTKVTYTYSVNWQQSDTPFATRWDKYLHVYDPKIQWFSLTISALVVLALISMVSTVLLRTLRKDIARYNRLDQIAMEDLAANGDVEDVQEDSGWKLIHGDVFRPPRQPLLLSVFLGNGTQLFMMVGFTILFALLGFLSPSNRGSLATVMILLYTFLGFIGGYVSARTYKFFQGEKWKQNFALTPVVIPGCVFAVFFLLNLFVWARGASGAVPFTTMLVLVCMWFIISLPLSLTGSWVGFRQAAIHAPVRTNQIPRQIPLQQGSGSGSGIFTGYLASVPRTLLVGMPPFGAIATELYFIIYSIWFNKIYYMFGFLFLGYVLMVITCAAVTVLMIYFTLCAENYHWQWRSFMMAGATAAYVFGFAMLCWVRSFSFASWTSGILYLGYSALVSALCFVLTGTIGFFASWLFVMRIYASIKVD